MSNQETTVLHLVPALFGVAGVTGGAERYVWELARHMADRVSTKLVTFGDRPRKFLHEKLDVRVIGGAYAVRGNRLNAFSIRLLSHLGDVTVIHCHQTHVVASSFMAVVARLTGKRVYTTDLGGGGWDVSSYVNTDCWYHGHLHISEYSRRVFGHGDKEWAQVILGGVDPYTFYPSPTGYRPEGPVLFVGRLMAHKGVNDLIDAAPPELPVTIIGRPYQPNFADLLERRAAGKRVTFRHNCDDASLLSAYQGASCVVLPSVYRDVFGNSTGVPELLGQTLLEGMACGIPVIATAVASLPEVVEDGVCGLIVPPNDPAALRAALLWLRTNPDAARRMGEAGRKRVLEKFTWSAVVERCLTAYGHTT